MPLPLAQACADMTIKYAYDCYIIAPQRISGWLSVSKSIGLIGLAT